MFRLESQGAVDVMTTNVPLNHENAADFVKLIDEGHTDGKPMLVFDMSEVPLLDSAGLEALLDSQELLQARGGELKLATLSPLCAEILRITGVDESFETHQNVKAAVGSFVQ